MDVEYDSNGMSNAGADAGAGGGAGAGAGAGAGSASANSARSKRKRGEITGGDDSRQDEAVRYGGLATLV